MPAPAIDVVILTWNDGNALGEAVASALQAEEVSVSAVVVDNGSEPPATVPGGVDLLRNDTNRGVAAARNQGARAGSAPLLCFLDSDARLEPQTLRTLSAAVQDDVAVAVPVFDGQRPEASAGAPPTLARKVARVVGLTDRYRPTPGSGRVRDVGFAIGACQLVRRDVFEAVGGLDERYFYGPEDVDFCLRVRAAGWRIVQVADAICHHPPRRRHRRLLTRAGLRHAVAVVRHLWKWRGT